MLSEKDLKNIERKAKEYDIKEIVGSLKNQLGARMTTYMSGRSDARVLDLWISGKEKPTLVEELRLRYSYWAMALVVSEYDVETASSMLLGMNRYLGDKAPASWLREHEKEEDLKEVVNAALTLGEMGV